MGQAHDSTQFINEKQLAEQLSISVETIRMWRYKYPTEGPKWHKFGRSVRYSITSVERWIADNPGEH
jgi:predicted DNA-binding transcriptional regulator AlpA